MKCCGLPTVLLSVVLTGGLFSSAYARPPAEKLQLIDAGSFAVFVDGQRIATETFRIEQGATVNSASAEFKAESGEKSVQKAEMQITPGGDLQRYEWHELSPTKAQIVVEPNDQFLVERLVPDPPQRPVQQSFLLPPSTVVLDDYFFSQRELLVWRYLSQACGNSLKQCHPGRTQFGVLVPRQRITLGATLEYVGPEKVNLKGTEHELNRINLKVGDDPDWVLYLDGDLKLVRIAVPAEKIEVVRE